MPSPSPAADERARGRARAHRRGRAAVLAALATVGLAACGLRLETPPPTAPEPDAVETIRQRATADALTLAVLAEHAADPAVPSATRVAEVASLHAEALGGPYTWQPPEPSPAVTATPADDEAAAAQDVGPERLVQALEETAASARADAAAVDDPGMARLLGSVSASRLLLADAVRRESGQDAADPPEPFAPPEDLPDGLTGSAVTALVQSEDALGLAWEVVAARTPVDARAPAAGRAEAHRGRALHWAEAADLVGTGLDPRRAAYDLPASLLSTTDPAALEGEVTALERDLATSYASLVDTAAPEQRAPLLDGLLDAARAGWPAGALLPAFPGMPEQEPTD
ncbi:DUF4439 domain-containing protein [Cellulomonas sp. APG4]|uniref:DUF4439 domain-containing protein n=1 Tax=Cellulomonas sp. APG4 TaxID=1538656 RepID=UPI00137B7E27|nr:DUF4439 domain-containing protein [Cellulomonas sp. APG4]NCT92205.1 DUF4439 domain-containing protein [Cellulomonas sp. APG4]